MSEKVAMKDVQCPYKNHLPTGLVDWESFHAIRGNNEGKLSMLIQLGEFYV